MNATTPLDKNLFAIVSEFEFAAGIYTRSYLVIGVRGVALVDAGISGTETQVLSLMQELGLAPRSLRLAIVAHAHADHAGGLAGLVAATGCLVAVQKAGALLLRDRRLMYRDFMDSFPLEIQITDQMRDRWHAIAGDSADADIQFDGDGLRIDLGGVMLETWHAPGHSADSTCVYEPSRKWLFTGDSICGRGPFGEPPCYRDAAVYRNTLNRLRLLLIDRLLAGHFPPMDHNGAEDLFAASLQRVDEIDAIVRGTVGKADKGVSLGEVAQEVARGIGADYVVQAVFTANAHLLGLERAGVVFKYGTEDRRYFLA